MLRVGPGTVLGGRYSVTVRTSQADFHERWRATDTTLERDVVLVCFPADNRSAAPVLDAARRAAGVEDSRLVRVLDVGVDGTVGFVVEEPLTGALPLSHLLQSGGLHADEVRRITGEAAKALDKARHRGLHHLALTPSSVLRTPDGDVKVRGLATDAALSGSEPALGGDADAEALRIDAIGLVKIAYAGLTARWPEAAAETGHHVTGDRGDGQGPSARSVGLEPAPTIVGGVASPAEISVGVPNDLDLICRLTLNDDAGPLSPGDLAVQIAPWSREPASLAPTPFAQASAVSTSTDAIDPRQAVPPGGRHAGRQGDTQPYEVVQGDAAPTGGGSALAGAVGATGLSGATATTRATGATGATATTEATGVAGVVVDDRAGSFARAAAERDTGPMPATAAGATNGSGGERHTPPRSRANDDSDEPLPVFGRYAPDRPSTAQSRVALAIVGVLVLISLVIGINNVLTIGQRDPDARVVTVTSPAAGTRPSSARPPTTPAPATTTVPPAVPTVPVSFVSGRGFDPQDDNTESDQNARLAYDGNTSSGWRSRWYGTDDYNGDKQGVGLVLDLSAPIAVKEVDLVLPAAQDVTVYAANSASLTGAQTIGSVTGATGKVTVKATVPTTPTSKIIVWVTKPAPAEAARRFRAQVDEVTVR